MSDKIETPEYGTRIEFTYAGNSHIEGSSMGVRQCGNLAVECESGVIFPATYWRYPGEKEWKR